MSGIQAPWIGYCQEEYDEICGYADEEDHAAYLADYADELHDREQEDLALQELSEEGLI